MTYSLEFSGRSNPPDRFCANGLRGFTIIELLVVVSIISVLIAMLLPSLSKAREQAKTTRCLANIRQNILPGAIYAHDNQGMFPTKFNLDGATPASNTFVPDFALGAMHGYVTGEPTKFSYSGTTEKFAIINPANISPVFLCPNNINASTLWGGKWRTSYGYNNSIWSRRIGQYQVRFFDVASPSSKVFNMDWAGSNMRTDRYNKGLTTSVTFGGSYVPGFGARGPTYSGTWLTEERQDFFEARHKFYNNVGYVDGHAATKSSEELIDPFHFAGTATVDDYNIYRRRNNIYAIGGN